MHNAHALEKVVSKRWVAAFHLCGRATTNSGWHNARTGNTVSRTAPFQSHTFASALIAYIHILAHCRAIRRCILQIEIYEIFNTMSANQNVCFVLQNDCMASNWVVPSSWVPVLGGRCAVYRGG